MYHNTDGSIMRHKREDLIRGLRKSRAASDRVLGVMNRVPRHLFVSEALRFKAYSDISLPIGFGQTISKPSIIARMVHALDLRGGERVLEIGTGSGYQTAILAESASSVVTMERIQELFARARSRLMAMNYSNIQFHCADDFGVTSGLFHCIIVSAGAESLPQEIFHKLEEGGILVIPVQGRDGHDIKRFIKSRDEVIDSDCIGEATFVPYITG